MSTPATQDIPFIYLTGMVVRQEVEEADHMIGGHYFAAKPVRKPELLHAIDLVLQDKKGEVAPTEVHKAPPKKPMVYVAELLGHKLKIEEDSNGNFQMSITGLKTIKGNTTFSALKDAQEAAHALLHFHVQRVRYCTCGKPLEWKESVE